MGNTLINAKVIIVEGKTVMPELIDSHVHIYTDKECWKDRVNNFKMLLEKGIKIALGSDVGIPYIRQGDNARELSMFVELGMLPMDAIIAATRIAAEAIGATD